MNDIDKSNLQAAAEAIAASEALLICAGAGMGVDSGLPDFRGPEGFWRAYPAAEKLGLTFSELANPKWFRTDPHLAWGFYGHRLNLYRRTHPHPGYALLRRWAESKSRGFFVFTSNVDGQFQQAGFDEERIVECHGSLRFLQCEKPCCAASWPMPSTYDLKVDEETLRAADPLPTCSCCGGLARPNVLMFGDNTWSAGRASAQQIRFRLWLRGLTRGHLAVIELGAGATIPTVRQTSEQIARASDAHLIRINPLDSTGPSGTFSFSSGALDTLQALDRIITPSRT